MDSTLDSLKRIALLAVLPDEVLARLPQVMTDQRFEQGAMLFHKGDPGGSMLLIQEGMVAIVIDHPDGSEEVLNQVGPGDAIGQISLVEASPRTAGAKAVSPVWVRVLTHEDFDAAISDQPEEIIDALQTVSHQLRLGYLDILKQTRIFTELPEGILTNLARKLTVVRLNEGQVLFHKGDPGDALYIIDEGSLKIVTADAAGGELVLNKVGAGDAIGEMALVDGEPRSAGAVATQPTALLRLSRADFMEAIRDQPSIALEMLKNVTGRLRFATTYIEQAIQWSERIAKGDYGDALHEIQDSQSSISRSQAANEARATELLSAFFQMVRGVQEREESLKQQLRELTIEIDEVKRKREVENLTGTEFFSDLKAQARKLREQRDADE